MRYWHGDGLAICCHLAPWAMRILGWLQHSSCSSSPDQQSRWRKESASDPKAPGLSPVTPVMGAQAAAGSLFHKLAGHGEASIGFFHLCSLGQSTDSN